MERLRGQDQARALPLLLARCCCGWRGEESDGWLRLVLQELVLLWWRLMLQGQRRLVHARGTA